MRVHKCVKRLSSALTDESAREKKVDPVTAHLAQRTRGGTAHPMDMARKPNTIRKGDKLLRRDIVRWHCETKCGAGAKSQSEHGSGTTAVRTENIPGTQVRDRLVEIIFFRPGWCGNLRRAGGCYPSTMHRRSRMTIDPRISTVTGRRMAGARPTRQTSSIPSAKRRDVLVESHERESCDLRRIIGEMESGTL